MANKDKETVLMTSDTKSRLEELLRRRGLQKDQIAQEKLEAVDSQGDTHDNFAYEESMRKLELAVRGISDIKGQLDNAQIISPNTDRSGIGIGHRVNVTIGKETTDYTILGPLDSDPEAGRISFQSPVARALIGKKATDTFDITTPDGIVKARINSFGPGKF